MYTLSPASRDAVGTLREPLTVRAFFSPNVPAPYNSLEQQVRDLLQEYAAAGNGLFTYSVYRMEAPKEKPETAAWADMARSYRIYPVQIQDIDHDEVKLVNAYMGLAFIHGDQIETIPAVTTTDGLELRVTEAIRGLSDRVSALLAMKQPITVTLYFSSSLADQRGELGRVPGRIESILAELNARYYGRLEYRYRDPDGNPELAAEAGQYRIPTYRTRDPRTGRAATAFAGLLVTLGERVYATQILVWDTAGARTLTDDTIKAAIEDSVNGILGIHNNLGYMVDFGTPPTYGRPQPSDRVQTDLSVFDELALSRYELRDLSVASVPIPETIGTMMVVSPVERLSEYALYQIDQFLMRGNSLMFFLDAFTVTIPGRSQGAMYGEARYEPRDTGLPALLEHHGVRLVPAYVLDEDCYIERSRTASGGMTEMPVYFVPMIRRRNLDDRPNFVKNLDAILVPNVSPLESLLPRGASVTIRPVLASSRKAWRERDPQVINYLQMLRPPTPEQKSRQIVAYVLEGRFRSYFAERSLPAPPQEGQDVGARAAFVPESRGGRIFVIGTSSVLGANLLDAAGQQPNSQFVLNAIDAMSGREDLAEMRLKGSMVSRLNETSALQRSLIKTMNIAGLPALVALAGLGVLLHRGARQRRIREAFVRQGDAKE